MQLPRTKVFNNSGFPHPEIPRANETHICSVNLFSNLFVLTHDSRVDSRSTSLGGINIFCARFAPFTPIRPSNSSAAKVPIWQVP